jgi:hypothetical protein
MRIKKLKQMNVYDIEFDINSYINLESLYEDINNAISSLKITDINDLDSLFKGNNVIICLGKNYLSKDVYKLHINYIIINILFVNSGFLSVEHKNVIYRNYINIDYLLEYEYMKKILDIFVYNRLASIDKEAQVKALYLFEHNHRFFYNLDLYYKQLYDLFQLHQTQKLYVYPNPLIIFLIEGKLYYDFIIKMKPEFKKEILKTSTVIHPETIKTYKSVMTPLEIRKKYESKESYFIKYINQFITKREKTKTMEDTEDTEDTEKTKKIEEILNIYISYAIQKKYIITMNDDIDVVDESDYIKMALSGSSLCAKQLYIPDIISNKNLLYLLCAKSGIVLFQKKVSGVTGENELRFFFINNGINMHFHPINFKYHVGMSLDFYRTDLNSYDKKLIDNCYIFATDLVTELSKLFGTIYFGRIDIFVLKDRIILNEIEIYPGNNTTKLIVKEDNKNNETIITRENNSFLDATFTKEMEDKIKNITPYFMKSDIQHLETETYLETMLRLLYSLLPEEYSNIEKYKKELVITHRINKKRIVEIDKSDKSDKSATTFIYEFTMDPILVGGNNHKNKTNNKSKIKSNNKSNNKRNNKSKIKSNNKSKIISNNKSNNKRYKFTKTASKNKSSKLYNKSYKCKKGKQTNEHKK